jgi:hypothetical protein
MSTCTIKTLGKTSPTIRGDSVVTRNKAKLETDTYNLTQSVNNRLVMDTAWYVIDVQKSSIAKFDVVYAIAGNGWSVDFACDEQVLGKVVCKSLGRWVRPN